MKYRNEKFYWTYQRGVGWPDDYVSPDSMTRWVIENSQGFTDVGLYNREYYRILEYQRIIEYQRVSELTLI